ncbi:MAG: hypothetical protein ACE5IL_12995 [Myxococcota bacterium]
MIRRAAALAATLALAACSIRGVPLISLPKPSDPLARGIEVTERLRGLRFLSPVDVEWIPSSRVPEITRAEMLAELPDDYVEAYTAAYVALGVLPPGIDLVGSLTRLQEDQLVGLYSTRLRKLFVVRAPAAGAGYLRSTILVHELVHALQHQHFPSTIELLQGLRRDDDVVSALSAALEGDASFTMLGAGESDGRSMDGAISLSHAMRLDLDHPTGVLAQTPHFLGFSLLFPYVWGIVIAAERWQERGAAGLDALMAEPPLSSLRVLYPDDADPVAFVRLPRADLEAAAHAAGCELGHDNVAGALTVRVLFEEYGEGSDLDPLLRAWSGDRFVAAACADGAALWWLTRWDDAASARRFAERYRRIAAPLADASGLHTIPSVRQSGRRVLVATAGLATVGPASAEVRSYDGITDWVADACFPESPCPVSPSDPGVHQAARAGASARLPSQPRFHARP